MAEPQHARDARLIPLTESDFPRATRLAGAIWREHYTAMVGAPLLEHLLGLRFVPEKLRAYLGASDRWFELLVRGDEAVGYCSSALTAPGEMKLEQLYVHAAHRGLGLGGRMLAHVERRARAHGCRTLMLTVARANHGSIAVYRRSGFVVREAVVIDVGDGFVMDDYVMVKSLGS